MASASLNSTALGARIGTAADVFGQFVFRNNGAYRDGLGTLVRDTGNELTSGLTKINIRPADGHEITARPCSNAFDFANAGTSNTGARFANAVQADTYTLGYRFARPTCRRVDVSIRGYYTTTQNDLTFLQDSPSGFTAPSDARAGNRITYDLETAGFDVHNTARIDTLGAEPRPHRRRRFTSAITSAPPTMAGGFGAAFTPSGERSLAGAFVQDEIRYASCCG